MDIITEKRNLNKKILTAVATNDFAFPIYVQRRSNIGITVICPDMNIARTLPLPQTYNKISDFYFELALVMAEVDQLAVAEFKKRDKISNKKHRETLFPRGLKDHLGVDIHKLKFKPNIAAKLTTKSERTWQRWSLSKSAVKKFDPSISKRKHHLIPFKNIEPFLKKEFIENPNLILSYIKKG